MFLPTGADCLRKGNRCKEKLVNTLELQAWKESMEEERWLECLAQMVCVE